MGLILKINLAILFSKSKILFNFISPEKKVSVISKKYIMVIVVLLDASDVDVSRFGIFNIYVYILDEDTESQ